MIDAALACGHSVRRAAPGNRVWSAYRCWRCKSTETVLRWRDVTPAAGNGYLGETAGASLWDAACD